MSDKWLQQKVKFHGRTCVVRDECVNVDNQYVLVPLEGTYDELQKDPSFHDYHFFWALATPVTCKCGYTTWCDLSKVEPNTMYDCVCEKCGFVMRKKKI